MRDEEGAKGVPAVPAVPHEKTLAPPVPSKSPSNSRAYAVSRSSTNRSVKTSRSVPLMPKSPRSPLSPKGSSRARQSQALYRAATIAAANKRQHEATGAASTSAPSRDSVLREAESPVEGTIERKKLGNGYYIGCRERGMSLEGKARRELARLKVQRLDVEAAEQYRTGMPKLAVGAASKPAAPLKSVRGSLKNKASKVLGV